MRLSFTGVSDTSKVARLTVITVAHATFFGFASESEDPRNFPKSLAMLQVVDTVMYLVSAMVIYHYAGPDVRSPALSSAGPLMKKVCYGLAIPTVSRELYVQVQRANSNITLQVVISGVVMGHVACKYIYVRIFRGTDHMHQRSFLSIGSWVGIALAVWTVAWIIAESIPVFNDLLSLIVSTKSSLLGNLDTNIICRARYLEVCCAVGLNFPTEYRLNR